MSNNLNLERIIERGLFASRWIMAPFYIGLSIALLGMLYIFVKDLFQFFMAINTLKETEAILGILSLIDLSLAGNLMLIVIFSGYQNFVSSFIKEKDYIEPDWKGTVDYSTLKLKLISSIVAISGIHLLGIFMSDGFSVEKLKTLLVAHLVFVLAGVLLALMDYISTKAKKLKEPNYYQNK